MDLLIIGVLMGIGGGSFFGAGRSNASTGCGCGSVCVGTDPNERTACSDANKRGVASEAADYGDEIQPALDQE